MDPLGRRKDMVQVMDPSSSTADESLLTRQKSLWLLNAQLNSPLITTEEQLHPWRANRFQTFEVPFLRIWDRFSGSEPDGNNRMMSRAPHKRLDTIESRKTTLATHLNHKDWTPTPYISFTTSAEAVEELVNFRTRRGAQTLTVIDPNTRLRDDLPILDVAAEMHHYGIPDPYGKGNQYYINHYVCLWEVTGKEAVGHWPWKDLVAKENWYEEIIMPAFRQFRRGQVPASTTGAAFDLLAAMDNLSLSDPSCFFYDDSDTFSEGYDDDDDLGWDTDDEVEEANAADDMIKILEGDW